MANRLTQALFFLAPLLTAADQETKLTYPQARKMDLIETLHGVPVTDPYRWLEDTDSKETQEWVAAENQVTDSYLSRIPGRDQLKDRLTRLYNYERFTNLFKRGGRYFIFRNDGLQNQDVIYSAASLSENPKVLLDPNTLRKDGTAALSGMSPDRTGKLLGYAIAQAGSDWSEWRVRDIAKGADLPDLIRWTKFTNLAWMKDGSGFYYSRYPQPAEGKMLTSSNVNSKVYYHQLGEDQSADKLIYERTDHPDWRFTPQLSQDNRYLIINVNTGDAARNRLFYRDLQAGGDKTVELISQLKAAYEVIGTQGSVFYILTTDNAPTGRVIAIDVARPEESNWKTIVPAKAETLEDARLADGKLTLLYLKDAHSEMKLYSIDGQPIRDIAMPGIGSAGLARADENDTELFYHFVSFTDPGVIYRLDLRTGQTSPVRRSKLSFDPAKYETNQIFYRSKDGTRIPMFLTHKKGMKLDGNNPTILYGYGGFNIPLTPTFNPERIAWLEMGGLYATANLRGGSEYGEAWHQAGMLAHKQNVFDDFIAAAEWLIANKYTSTPKLAIYGGSNGGLLVGACVNQRPELFGAAMPAVGVMDMLRFHKFTVGAGWTGDYGSPDNEADFKVLRAYSPLHNIRKGVKYPPTLITTSDHDDRVVPGHSFKYAAALQAAQEGPAPILIRIETRAGHGGGKPTSKRIEEFADRLAFLKKELKMDEAK